MALLSPVERASGAETFHFYRENVGQPDLLTQEEVVRLAQCMEKARVAQSNPKQPGHRELIEAGKQARQRMIEANLRLVLHVARRYKGVALDLMDLVQEGNLGLIHAVEKFDYRKGYRFSTYAIWWIRQSIAAALTEQAQLIRVPLYKMEEIKQLTRAHWSLKQTLEKEPTLEDLAVELEMSVEEVLDLWLMVQTREPLSLDVCQRVGEDEIPLSDLLEDDQQYSPEQIVLTQTLATQLQELLGMLTPRERAVIRLRYGLSGYQSATLVNTALQTGLTHEGVRNTEARALKRLAAFARQRGLQSYLHG